jgi:tRNA modification GTPase
MTASLDDTIAAIATPIGEGGIGIVRISGRDAFIISEEIFRPLSGIPISAMPTHTAHYGYAVDAVTEEVIDDGIITVFRKPRSYTGEDTVEISCHGGIVPLRRILESALRAGARLAEPGEFTKRAFLNGKLDLAQAEAVLDIIRARTDEALRLARQQFDGVLSTRIRMLREQLLGVMARIEASIDFPDDVDDMPRSQIADMISEISKHVAGLLDTADRGRIYREGIRVVIAGRPNVGKSSLLNALVRESRAIVTPIPGTTRDVIEESINIQGIPVRAIDTAGFRQTNDEVERIGVDRARAMVEQADLVLVVIDAGQGFTEEDKEVLSDVKDKRFIVVLNKSDLIRNSDAETLSAQVQDWIRENISSDASIVRTAAISNEGIIELENAIAEKVLSGSISLTNGAVVSNVRHRRALEEASTALRLALQSIHNDVPLDLITIDLRNALDALGAITGETVSEDIIDRIFSEFCIGK